MIALLTDFKCSVSKFSAILPVSVDLNDFKLLELGSTVLANSSSSFGIICSSIL